jgi:hypothetical protein
MKRALITVALALIGATLLTGCKRQPAGTAADSEVTAVPQFSAKNGLALPEQTRQSLGVKLVEVTERKLASSMNIELRIYRKEATTAFASGAVTPEQAKLLKPGRSVEVHLPDGVKRTAKVTGVSDALQRTTGSVEVLVEIPRLSDSLAMGAFVQASVTTESEGSVGTIPRSALLGCSEGRFVYTVSGEHLVRTAVKVGAANAEFVEITDGLYAGDQVVLQPVMSLWMAELAAVKGGQACCIEPPKGK